MEREKKIYRDLRIGFSTMMVLAAVFFFSALMLMKTQPRILILIILADIFFVCCIAVYYRRLHIMISEELEEAGFEQSQVLKTLMKSLPSPYVLTDLDGNIIWNSDRLEEVIGNKSMKKNISQIFDSLNKKTFPPENKTKQYYMTIDDKEYRVECHHEKFDGLNEEKEPEEMLIFYFYDETELIRYKNESESKNLVVGLIYIDNYEEVLESMEEVRQSLLFAVVERKIYKYMSAYKGIGKRFEKDKYLFVFEAKYLPAIMEDKFSLMDEVRNTTMGNSIDVTLSIGIGANAPDYEQAYESSRAAIDMALGRGGDQAVVREQGKISYFGGNSQKVEKSTRVKARVKAHALRELMLLQDKVFVMGHKYPDADSIGAAIGIYRMAKTFQKEAYIVVDETFPAISPIVESIKAKADGEEIFITADRAVSLKTQSSVVVVVDTNIPSMTEAPAMLKNVRDIVVLDHHRQTQDTIKNAVLSYIEPYASSTCEMVSEVLQYISDKPKLKSVEADALYSGILIDTDNFVVKAGVRTFEAAAYLRRAGADVTRVRKMFREDMEQSQMKAKIINNAEIFMNEFAISVFDGTDIPGATVIGAKAANALLGIQGVKGSFVLTKLPEYIYISARSIDELNVHLVMEKLGGGGHLSVAAAQVRGKTIEQVQYELKSLLQTLRDNGDI